MAAMVARNHEVRKHFSRISFLSLGLEPDIPSLQRQMHLHLSGAPMPSGSEPTIELQRAHMVKMVESRTKQGERFLLILDDCWKVEHEMALNVFEDENVDCGHRILITTRTAVREMCEILASL